MAEFNPQVNVGEPANMTGRSQGIPDTNIFETLFRGVGNIAEGVATGLDLGVKKSIRQDVEDMSTVQNDQYGLGVQDAASGVKIAASGSDTPTELQPAKDRLNKLQTAYARGALSESAYWAQITMKAKELRSRYPGYNAEIDDIIQQVTGGNPANRLRDARLQEINDQINADKQNATADERWIDQNADVLASMGIDGYSGEMDITEMKRRVASRKGQDYVVESQNKALELGAKNEGIDAGKLRNIAGVEASQIASRTIAKFANVAKVNGNTVAAILSRATSPNPDEVAAMTELANKAEIEARGQLREMFNRQVKYRAADGSEQTTTYGAYLDQQSPGTTMKMTEEALADLTTLKGQLSDKDWTYAGATAILNKGRVDYDIKTLSDLDPNFRKLQGITQINRDAAAQFMLADDGTGKTVGDKITALLLGTALPVSTGQATLDDALTAQLQNKETMSTAELSKAADLLVTKVATQVADPSIIPDNQFLQFLSKNFAEEKPGIDRIFTQVAPGSKEKIFKAYTNPKLIDRIVKTGNSTLIEAYKSWVYDKFLSMPAVQSSRATIMQAMPNDPRTGKTNRQGIVNNYTITFDPKAKQFAIQSTAKSGTKTDVLEMNTIKRIKTEILDPINQYVGNVAMLAEKTGTDPLRDITGLLDTLNIGKAPSNASVSSQLVDSLMGAGDSTSSDGGSSTGENPLADPKSQSQGFTNPFSFPKTSQLEDVPIHLANYSEDARSKVLQDTEATVAEQDKATDTPQTFGLAYNHPWQAEGMQEPFKALLEDTSKTLGRRLVIASGHRPQAYNAAQGSTNKSRHIHGDAADISMKGMSNEERANLVRTLMAKGVHRFITYSKMPDMIHVDMSNANGKLWFMHDKTHSRLRKAPQWFRDIYEESK